MNTTLYNQCGNLMAFALLIALTTLALMVSQF
mgnify:CR=1 FL=1